MMCRRKGGTFQCVLQRASCEQHPPQQQQTTAIYTYEHQTSPEAPLRQGTQSTAMPDLRNDPTSERRALAMREQTWQPLLVVPLMRSCLITTVTWRLHADSTGCWSAPLAEQSQEPRAEQSARERLTRVAQARARSHAQPPSSSHSPRPACNMAVKSPIQRDWEQREFIEMVSVNVKKITEFLNKFGTTIDDLEPSLLTTIYCGRP